MIGLEVTGPLMSCVFDESRDFPADMMYCGLQQYVYLSEHPKTVAVGSLLTSVLNTIDVLFY